VDGEVTEGMRVNLVKFAGIAVGVAALILLVAAPTLSAASMAHDMSPSEDGATMPQNCSHCVLTNADNVVRQVLTSNRLTMSENVDPFLSPTSLTAELSPNQGVPFQGDTVQASPPVPLIEYHCLNSADSDEPPL
jgi:hypothetical protein